MLYTNTKKLVMFLDIFLIPANNARQPSIDFHCCYLSSSDNVVYKERWHQWRYILSLTIARNKSFTKIMSTMFKLDTGFHELFLQPAFAVVPTYKMCGRSLSSDHSGY
jgi:hypothetical protein